MTLTTIAIIFTKFFVQVQSFYGFVFGFDLTVVSMGKIFVVSLAAVIEVAFQAIAIAFLFDCLQVVL